MNHEWQEMLVKKDVLTPLDVHFARLTAKLAGKETPELFLAAALASHSQGEGHVCFDLSSLAGKRLLGEEIDFPACPGLRQWQAALEKENVVGRPGDKKPLILDGSRLYLYRYWEYEKKLVDLLKERTGGGPADVDEELLRDGLSRFFPRSAAGETDGQKVAAFASILKRFCVISGGPGTGKTFTVSKILALLLEQEKLQPLRIALAAPTGKAAARLQEAIKSAREGLDCSAKIKAALPAEASTIHRLLEAVPGSPYFRFDEKNLLPRDVVVVDEASMVDLALLSKLVQALPSGARLILLGDKDQLASVEAGAVLGDLCDTGNNHGFSREFAAAYQRITGESLAQEGEDAGGPPIRDAIVQLRKNYRFGAASGIGVVSRAVNEGDGSLALDLMKNCRHPEVRWHELPRPESLAAAIRDRVAEGFSGIFRPGSPGEVLDRFYRLRILCAVREGPYGVRNLNLVVENILEREGLIRRGGRWYTGRPVMVTRNDYPLRLFNGDVGLALPDPDSADNLRVFFPSPDGSVRKFPALRLPEHETVYAMTAHKSQGSEFDRVLLILPDRENQVLTRELIYTGMTRARETVEVWGREEIFRSAVARRTARASGLREALWG